MWIYENVTRQEFEAIKDIIAVKPAISASLTLFVLCMHPPPLKKFSKPVSFI